MDVHVLYVPAFKKSNNKILFVRSVHEQTHIATKYSENISKISI